MVNFTNDSRIIIHRDELFQYLLEATNIQLNEPTKSPTSQRSHPNLTRRQQQAYKQLLISAKALKERNKNTLVLKDEYVTNPWQLIQEMEETLPMEEI